MNNVLRKTHPMVLIAAVAVTVFSLLGSAAITGLIPSAHSEKQEVAMATSSPEKTDSAISGHSTTAGNQDKAASGTSKNMANDQIKPQQPKHSADNIPACANCGTIVSIQTLQHEGEGTGLGAVAGGVAGGLVGNQIGKGNGNTLMTILGLGGGAYAGHTIEKKMKSTTDYIIKVRMEDGSYRTITQHDQPKYAVGDQVKVRSGQLTYA